MAKQYQRKTKPGVGRAGRPLKIKTPAEFDVLVDRYVAACAASHPPEPVTWTGMALALGFYSRHELDEYMFHEGFSTPVKRAKMIVECAYERKLSGNNAAGPIFALKNMRWSDKQEIEHSGSMEFKHKSDDELMAELQALRRELT